MTHPLSILATEEVAALVAEGSGHPVIATDAEPPPDARTIAFADVATAADIVWPRVGGHGSARRTIATAGEELWRRAPWPAADDLFGWPAGDRVIVVGASAGAPVVVALAEADAPVEAVDVLAPDSLRAAAVVVFPGVAGDPLPTEAPAVLAAGRILVTTPRSPDFGLRAGIDHCVGPSAGELADLALSAVRHPRAFESMRVYGRLAAERHRASRVFADLAVDLELAL